MAILLPTREQLAELFAYIPEIGLLVWRERPAMSKVNKNFNARFADKPAGTLDSWGYRQIRVFGRLVLAHRIVWKMMTGEEPPPIIDHINGDQDDNRWENLREADTKQNRLNSKTRSDNKSGHRGVYRRPYKTVDVWTAKIRVSGKYIFLGDFLTKEEASSAYEEAWIKYNDPKWKRAA